MPNKIPEFIEVDVSHLGVGDSIHIEELILDASIEILAEENATVATCFIPNNEVEEVSTTAAVEEAIAAEVLADGEAAAAPAAATGTDGAPAAAPHAHKKDKGEKE